MGKQIKYGAQAREKMIKGIDILANAVKVTLGPKGRNVAIEQVYGPPRLTKDGVTVAKAIELRDIEENVGAQLVKSVASKTADVAGDGTTTSTLLTQAIVKEGNKAVAAGFNPMDLKRGIDLAVEKVIAVIKQGSQTISTHEEIAQVGTISANGDTEIGNTIAEAIEKVGKEGVITIEESNNFGFNVDVVEGMMFESGYISPHFVTNQSKMIAELENPFILIFDKKVGLLAKVLPILEGVSKASKPLLIIAEDVEGEALATIVLNKMRGSLKIAAVKSPSYGDHRAQILDDISTLTGAKIIGSELGVRLESVTTDDLGSAKKVTIYRDKTVIVGDGNTKSNIETKCEYLRSQIEKAESQSEVSILKTRLAKLVGGVAVLKVGGATEVEVKEKKDRVDDALNATRAAVEEGVVAGGGVALFYAAKILDELKGANDDQQAGIRIVRRALEAPIRQIAENAGIDGAAVVAKLDNSKSNTEGFNAQDMEYVDMFKAGIVDPTKVVRTALQDAASIASLVLTSECMISTHPEKLEELKKPLRFSPAQMSEDF
jgi:chaperonin GroEL